MSSVTPLVLIARTVAAFKLLFVGDSLSMPVHWFYDVRDIKRSFPPSGVTKFEAAPQYHPSSIMNLHSTKQGGRSSAASGSRNKEIVGDVILKGRREFWNIPNQHYHTGMKAGENTLNLQCARVLMRTLTKASGEYSEQQVLDDYVAFMTADPPQHRDTYAESYHRGFFANMMAGKPLNECGAVTHDTPSVGGLVSVGPLAAVLTLRSVMSSDTKTLSEEKLEEIKEICRKHVWLTHPDRGLAAVSDMYVSLVIELLLRKDGDDPAEILTKYATSVINTRSLTSYLQRDDASVIGGAYSPACYISGAWPSVLYLSVKYSKEPKLALLANANVGGDNCHRGAVLGFLLGLANSSNVVVEDLFSQLVESKTILTETNDLLSAIAPKKADSGTSCI